MYTDCHDPTEGTLSVCRLGAIAMVSMRVINVTYLTFIAVQLFFTSRKNALA